MFSCGFIVIKRSGFTTTDLCFRRFLSLSSSAVSSDTSTSLSARLSVVFDHIDAIDRDRSKKDEALQRIRKWSESRSNNNISENEIIPESRVDSVECSDQRISVEGGEKSREDVRFSKKEVELVHPWKEWIELMDMLVRQNYFDIRRKNEDLVVEKFGFVAPNFVENGVDFTRDFRTVRMACVNFGRDRFDILRSLSKKDIQIMVGYGCPSLDKKVIFSGKLLRKYTYIDEGDVCSACNMRNSCDRAYLVLNKEDEARTVDIVRIIWTFAFDSISGTVTNKYLLELKSVMTSVRKLLHNVVRLGYIPIDPTLPPPVIRRPLPKIKQPPPQPKRRVGRDDIEMKKGDWLCPKCDFMNFSKNTTCLQCNAKRPKRDLLPGEWECPGCNFLNYRRNMSCFNCDHKRPADGYTIPVDRYPNSRPVGPRRVPDRDTISNAWNLDFDDDESDGADVATFETADSPRLIQEPLSTGATHGPIPGPGFNDFDDEDDSVDSYDLDFRKPPPSGRGPGSIIRESGPSRERGPGSRNDRDAFRGRDGGRNTRSDRTDGRRKTRFSDDDDEEDDIFERKDRYRSSGVRNRGRGRMGLERGGRSGFGRTRSGPGRSGRGQGFRPSEEFDTRELPNRQRVLQR